MLLKGRKIAIAGLLVAVTVILMFLSSTIEMNSLFFIAAASFCVGIVIRELGHIMGVGFLVASVALNLILVPNKIYCITFAGMSFYLILSEWLWSKIADAEKMKHRYVFLWIGKYVIFNLMYIPTIYFVPTLIFTKNPQGIMFLGFWLIGQAALFVYDCAYQYFQGKIWGKMRKKLLE